MAENEEVKSPLKDSKPMVERNEKGQLLPGSVLNPKGYTKGKRNFITDLEEVIEEYAAENKIDVAVARKIILKKALTEAHDGKYPFYKDIIDRVYGPIPTKLENDPDNPLILQVINYGTKDNNNSTQLQPERIPDAISIKSGEVQDTGVAQEIRKEQDGAERTDKKDPVEEGNLLLHPADLPPSETSDLGRPDKATPSSGDSI